MSATRIGISTKNCSMLRRTVVSGCMSVSKPLFGSMIWRRFWGSTSLEVCQPTYPTYLRGSHWPSCNGCLRWLLVRSVREGLDVGYVHKDPHDVQGARATQ